MAICKMSVENTSAIGAKMAQEIVQKASEYQADMILRYENKRNAPIRCDIKMMTPAVCE